MPKLDDVIENDVIENEVVVPQPEPIMEDDSDGVVAYESHKKLLNQHKQAKSKANQLTERVAQLEAEKESQESARLHEKQEYKTLYENAVDKIKTMSTENERKERALVDEHKRRALEKELGGVRHSDYLTKFADLENIVIGDDGLVDSNSVIFESNRFRQLYPELLKGKEKIRMNYDAPDAGNVITQQKSANDMSKTERSSTKRDFLRKKYGK